SVVFSPDNKHLAGAFRAWGRSGSRDVQIWNSETGQEVLTLSTGNKEGISSLAFSPDGQRLVGGSWDKMVRGWEVQSGTQVGIFKGHTNAIDSVAYSPDGQHLASASLDGTVKVWQADEQSSQEKHIFFGRRTRNFVRGVAFSPDGKRLVSASTNRLPS